MKKFVYIAILTVFATMWCACEDYETYAEMKEREKAYINDFIRSDIRGRSIKVITKEEFEKDTVTNVEDNEYVLFADKGIYMQIVRRGEGRLMEDGARGMEFVARYLEYNIETGDTISGNLFDSTYDKFTCDRSGATFSATFTQGHMLSIYGSSNKGRVPSGWLVPLNYITPGRPNDKGSVVRLIVPHSEGTPVAAQYVYPTYYEITYIPGKD